MCLFDLKLCWFIIYNIAAQQLPTMDKIRIKESDNAQYKRGIIEKNKEIKEIDLKIGELSISKEEIQRNIKIKIQLKQSMPEGEQYDHNRNEIFKQIEGLQRRLGKIHEQVREQQEKKGYLNGDISLDEVQIDQNNKYLNPLKRGAQLTSTLRKEFDTLINSINSIFNAKVEIVDQFQQEQWFKKSLETIDKTKIDAQAFNQKLEEKQSQDNEQIHPFTSEIRNKYNQSIKELDKSRKKIEKQYQKFRLTRQKQNERKESFNKKTAQLTESKYNKTQHYNKLLTKYQESLALPPEIGGQKSEKQMQDLKQKQLALHVLKQKQIYLSQMKILIELQQLDASVLKDNNFDLPKYKTLLAKKLQSIKAITSNPTDQSLKKPQFIQLNKQISTITANLNTTNLHIPYRYPIELLLTTKQQILEQHLTKLIKQKQEQHPKETQRTGKLLSQKKQLQREIALLKKEEEVEAGKYRSFTEDCVKELKETIKLQSNVEEILPLELKQHPKPINSITNLQEIAEKSKIFLSKPQHQNLINKYQELKAQSGNMMMKWYKLEQQYMNPYLASSLTQPIFPLMKRDQKTESLQKELARLLKTAKKIFEYREKEGDNSFPRRSNIGLYSSIY